MRWEPGDAVVLREVWHGRVWTARPAVVVEDTPEQQMFYVPSDVRWMCPTPPEGGRLRIPTDGWVLEERPSDGVRVLSFAWPGVAHAVLLMWSPEGKLLRWYVNLQEPLRRTAIGFDYLDHALDVELAPDRSSWSLKDEDELGEAVERGIFTREQAAEFHIEGARAAERVLNRVPPFDQTWEGWRPDPAWPVPELPPGWDFVG